ncbi:MAG: hypothetical protein ACI8P3_004117, partial [Saprospiraceae bacterium]
MNFLFYSNQGLCTPHLAIELELLDKLTIQGHEVHMVSCNNVLNSCYFNPSHNIVGCAICEAKTSKHYNLYNSAQLKKHKLDYYPQIEKIQFPFFSTIDDLLDYEYKNINIGRGVASSVISLFRETNINSHSHKDLIEQEIKMAINVMLNFEKLITQISPDCIYLFNGRFAESHPVIELAKLNNITYKTLEKGTTYGSYDAYTNSLPHSIVARQQKMDQIWNNANPITREETAKNWFQKK